MVELPEPDDADALTWLGAGALSSSSLVVPRMAGAGLGAMAAARWAGSGARIEMGAAGRGFGATLAMRA